MGTSSTNIEPVEEVFLIKRLILRPFFRYSLLWVFSESKFESKDWVKRIEKWSRIAPKLLSQNQPLEIIFRYPASKT